ncbi:MAG: 2-amino-4-hydroxy-6-hydroxymethyldihydropteridine diphosphokinase [Trueperaceae bacterium]
MGANLGDPAATLRRAWRDLDRRGEIERSSRLYRTDPVGGPSGQPPFRNAVVRWRPPRSVTTATELLAALHEIEERHGRTRRVRNEARTLDLDLIAWHDLVADAPDAVVPHPRALERAFVLIPLLDVDPAWRDPRSGRSARYALQRLRAETVHDLGVRVASEPWPPADRRGPT